MATPAPARIARPRRWLHYLCCAGTLLLLIVAVFLWRPLTVLEGIGRARLWISGVRDGTARAGPYRVHYLVAGSGMPVVSLHGLGGRGTAWGMYIPSLARQARVYAPDLLGFGSSDRPDVDYSAALQAQVLRDFLDSQQLQRADLVGISMGGRIALHFAGLYPDRVRRLVVADAPGIVFLRASWNGGMRSRLTRISRQQ